MDGYYELKAKRQRGAMPSDFTRYTVVFRTAYGKSLIRSGYRENPFVVYACRYSFEDQEMQGTYKITKCKGGLQGL